MPPELERGMISHYVFPAEGIMSRYRIGKTVIMILYCLGFSIVGSASLSGYGDYICGDVNDNGQINLLDITYLIKYVYMGGPSPVYPQAADVNLDSTINIMDIVYLIAFLYREGPNPVCEEPEPPPDSLPDYYDLRDVDGACYVSSIKSQMGGTCWAHATMASVESNLMMTGAWTAAGEAEEPDLAEYHLDWWNGFNNFWNPEVGSPGYVLVHEGGDYRMSSAYFSRGDGAVRDIDGQSFSDPPEHYSEDYHYFYVRDIEWYSGMMWEEEVNIDLIKIKVMDHGGVASSMSTDERYLYPGFICYVPDTADVWADHTVTIIGWDDSLITPAPRPGAWLCKNSWGPNWGIQGCLWISYYDKLCGKEPSMGAVSFYNVEPLSYDRFYVHDIHGWWGNLWNVYEAFNAFTTEKNELLMAVNFVTLDDSVDYTITLYDTFDGNNLSDELISFSGWTEFKGFHTVDLPTPLEFSGGNDFYIHLFLSTGKMAYDHSTYVEHMPGIKGGVLIESRSKPKQGYYRKEGGWLDLYDYDQTANFCIKGLGRTRSLKVFPEDSARFNGPKGGPIEPSQFIYRFTHRYVEPIDYQIEVIPNFDWIVLSGDLSGSLSGNDTGVIAVSVDSSMTAGMTEGFYAGNILFKNLDYPEDDIALGLELRLGTPQVQYEWLLDSDPGWTTEGEWEFGSPTGGGGTYGFGTDPVGGYTGDNVYGYNIDGNYPNLLPETHLTSGPVDCSKLFNVRLNFMKWLAADGFGYGHVKVSNNGSDWHTIWTGYDGVNLTWTEADFDISAFADFQQTVFLRWTMVVEGSPLYTHGGWNLDDIRIIAVYDSVAAKSPPINPADVTAEE
jgi:C1A family cysteine protease